MSFFAPGILPLGLLWLACLAWPLAARAAETTYRWVDEKGQVHYGDAMPSQQSGMGHSELDKQGRVVKQAPRTRLTPEEQRRRAEEAARKEAEKRAFETRQRADKALLSTYTRADEIDLARDRALELEKLSLDGVQLRLDRATKRLTEINADIDKLRQRSRVTPPYMATLKADAQNDVVQLSRQVQLRTQAIEDIRARYEADKARWKVLKGLQDSNGKP